MKISLRRVTLILLGLWAAFLTGCGRKEITSLQRKEGASLVSEANFAVSLRDYPRAETLFAQAVVACPDTTDYWIGLGTVRRKQDNRAGAKTAFEEALKASRDATKRAGLNGQLRLQQVYLQALLGRMDEARDTLSRARKDLPDNRDIRAFVEGNELDRILADPGFKDMMP
jgi:tetratricopeptide (TPR) repeat protein